MKAVRLLIIPLVLVLHAVTAVWAVDSLAGFDEAPKPARAKAVKLEAAAALQGDWALEDED